jgi:hypothetical protein
LDLTHSPSVDLQNGEAQESEKVMIMWMLSVRADGQRVIKKAFEQV